MNLRLSADLKGVGGHMGVARRLYPYILAFFLCFVLPFHANAAIEGTAVDDSVQKKLENLSDEEKARLLGQEPAGAQGIEAQGREASDDKATTPKTKSKDAGKQPKRGEEPEKQKKQKKQTTPSPFETFVQGKSGPDVSLNISQFGYDLFESPSETFAPVDTVPVSPDYVVGPGDEFRITLWGKLTTDMTVQVDRDGRINFPQVGVLHLAGMSFAQAKNYVEQELSRYYRPSEVKINFGMGRLRSIRVYVVGKAAKPGSYTVSSLSTLVTALFASGGASKSGSLRGIELRRNGQLVTTFDFYDFLLRGDKTKDAKLLSEDVIFIPPIGPLAGIAGNVRSPAIYELKSERTLKDLLELAGGYDDIAFKNRLQIERVSEDGRVVVSEHTLSDIDLGGIALRPGDLAKIYPVMPDKRFVRVSGAVMREGEFGLSEGMTLKDLVLIAGGLKFNAYTKEAELTRVMLTNDGPKTKKMQVEIGKALSGDERSNFRLEENDYLFIRTVPEWELYRVVDVEGEVRFPGSYTIEKGETLASLIRRAGGYTSKAYLKGAVFTRGSVKELQQRQLEESIVRLEQVVISGSAEAIASALSPEAAMQQKAALDQKLAFLDKLKNIEATGRVSLKLDSVERLSGTPSDLKLEHGDKLVIPERPNQVQVIGSVYNQMAFVHDPKATVGDYIDMAGGLTQKADEDELYVLKIDGTAISKEAAEGVFTSFDSIRLDPGDTIVAPERLEKTAWLMEIKDITQILYQIAVTAGVLLVSF